ncbi:MAG TPA: ADOP family duplicated permease [Thermoanaerobaculia bacterium]|nr:ADOP family duplicated permease [Thermoanaerobaculia bacterium]
MMRTTIRNLARRPAAPAIAALTLALGLATSTTLFTIVRDVVLRPFPVRDQERLVTVWSHIPERSIPHLELTVAEYDILRAQSKSIADMGVISAANFTTIINIPEPVQVRANFVTRTLYPLLGARALHGRLFTAAEHGRKDEHVILISHRAWMALFGGNPSVINRPIDVEGEKYTVVGVLPAELNIPAGAEIIFPMEPLFGGGPNDQHNSVLEGIARLKPGVTLAAAETEMSAIAGRLVSVDPTYQGVRKQVKSLTDEILGGTRPAMITLLLMSLLVLAISTFNAAGIFVARAVARQRDHAIRSVLGASRRRLLMEAFRETAAVSAVACILGLAFSIGAIALLRRAGADVVPRIEQVRVDLLTYFFAAAASLGVAAICALAASLRLNTQSLRDAIERSYAARRSARLLAIITAVQLTVVFVLLGGAALMMRSFSALANVNPGFRRDHVLTAQLPLPGAAYSKPGSQQQFFGEVVERLRRSPGITQAGAMLIRPLELEVGWDWTHTVEGQTPESQAKNPLANLVSATPGYFEAMGIPVLRGRTFDEHDDANAAKVMVVGRSFALRYWGTLDVIGKRVKSGKVDSDKPWRTITGVVEDVRYRGLTVEKLDVYHPYLQIPWAPQYVAVRTSTSPAAAAATLRSVVKSIDPRVPVAALRTTDELVETKLMASRFNVWIVTVFASVSLLLAIAGVYGVRSYAMSSRGAEMGVRMAIGASGRDLLRLMFRETFLMAAFALAAGSIAVLMLTRVVARFLYGVTPLEPLALVVAAIAVCVSAMAGGIVPAMRAASTDPVAALRATDSGR